MTFETFLTEIQNYYSQTYPEGQRRAVFEYLRNKSEFYLDALYDTALLRYSSKWGKAPDIAIFEELRPEALQRYHAKKDRAIMESIGTRRMISEDDVDIKALAKQQGIDTNTDGWLAVLLLGRFA